MRTKTKTGSLLSTALAMVLSLTMTVGLCPASALAAALEEDVAPVELEEDGGEAPAEGAEDGAGIQPEGDGEDALVVQGQEAEGEAELLPQEEPLVLEEGTNAEPDEDAPEAQGQEAEEEVALQPQGEQYALWVGGTQVTDASSSGDGWSYDAATSTLTLSDYSYGGDGHGFVSDVFGQGYAAIYAEQDLTIQLRGTNTLTNEKNNGVGVYVTGGNLTVASTDDGTLSATGERAGIIAYGGNVTVNGGTVNATGSGQYVGNGILGLSGMGATSGISITINGGKVTATGDECGMSAYAGDVTIAGGEVTATGNYRDGILAGMDKNHETMQTFGGNVTISGGTVTASGTRGNGMKGQDTVTIEGGEVSATSGMGDSAGIVGEQRVAFEGGTVYAAGNGDNGIGVSSWNNIDFNGGTITVFGKARGIAEDISVSFATGVSARAGEDESSAQPVTDIEQSHDQKWIQVREGSVQLWIGGDWVSEERETGDGWSFDPETYTLTLDGFTYDGDGYQCGIDEGDPGKGTRRAGIYYAGPRKTLTIRLKGESAITVTNNGVSEVSGATGNVAVGIWSERNVVVRAEEGGKLALTPQGHRSQGVQADSMTLENGELTVTTKNEAGGRRGVGVLAGDTLAIYGGTLTVKDESHADSQGHMSAITAKHITMDDGKLNIDMSSIGTNGGVECVGNPAWQEDWNNFGTFELNGGSVNIKAETAVRMQDAYFMVNGGSAELEGSDAAVVVSGDYYPTPVDNSMTLGEQVYAKYGQSKDEAVFYEGEGNKVYQALRKVDEGTDTHPAAKYVRLEPAHTHTVVEGEGAQTITFQLWTDALAAQQHGTGNYTAANSLPTEAGNYLLTKNVMLDETKGETWMVPEGTTNLCLGGKTIMGNLSREKNVIDIPANRTLNLYDDEEGAGRIVSKNYEVSGQPAYVTVVNCKGAFTMNGGTLSSIEGGEVDTGVLVSDGATFTMNGGTIQNAGYVGVYVNAYDGAEGTFTMSGGTITDCATGVWDFGTFTMSGGTITGCGSGVRDNGMFTMSGGTITGCGSGVRDNGTFTMSGGTITGCVTGVWNDHTFTMSGDAAITENTGIYGGVLVSAGTFNMQGGTISKNAALDGGIYRDGGGVYVQGGTFTMSGGTISENTANKGGGVYVKQGTFDMQGGSITQNQAKRITKPGLVSITYPGDGGGVCLDAPQGGTFAMTGGSITGNSAEDAGDGVCVYLGAFNLSGNPDISGNGGQNVYLKGNARITVAGALSNATPIGVAMYEPGVFTTSNDPKAKDFLSNFTSDDSKYTVVTKDDELALQHNTHSFTYAASGATITATCNEKGLCDLTDKKVALTIKAPTLTTYGQTGDGISEKATLDGLEAFNTATGKNVSVDSIRYFPARREGTEVKKTGEALSKAPTDAGDYMAEVTLTGVRTDDAGVTAVTAYVPYAIGKATPAVEHFDFAPPADPTHDGQAKTASVTAKAGVKGMGAVTVGYYSDAACTAAAEPRGVGTYYVGVTVAEGDNFLATAGGEVLHGEGWAFRIAKEPAVAARVSANGRTYDGASRPLVKVEGEATGGKMQYALGKDAKTAPADGWSTSIPAATDAGTYHVWYRVRGDANHGDLAAKPVKATVAPREAKLAWKGTSFTYDGKSHAPTATVSNLAAGDKCSVTVAGAAKAAGSHTATATKLGNANYKLPAKATQAFKIAKAKLTSIAKVADKTYTGKAIKPKPAVKAGKRALEAGTDFSYSYKNNVKAGTATVTAKGKGNYAGTVKTTFKVVAPSCSYRAHVQGTGWQAWAKGGSAVIGTSGKGLRLEAIQLKLGKSFPVAGGIEYRAHVQTYGWEKAWAKDGATCGTTGQSRRLEAIQVRLTGQMAKKYDVYYRVHAQTYGWMAWAKNGAKAGTEGQAKRLEAVQIVLLPKGAKAPGTTYEGVKQQYAKAFV